MVQCFRPIPWRRGNGKKLKSSLARPWRPSMSTVHDLDHTAQAQAHCTGHTAVAQQPRPTNDGGREDEGLFHTPNSSRPSCTMTGANLEMRGRRPGFLGLLFQMQCAVAGNAHRCRCFPAKSHRIGLLLLGHCRTLPAQPSSSCLAVVMGVKSGVDRMGREAANELDLFVYKTKADILWQVQIKRRCGNTQLPQNPNPDRLPNPRRPLSIQLSQFQTPR